MPHDGKDGSDMTLENINIGKQCNVVGCKNGAFCKGLCKAHYEQKRQHGRITGLVVPHMKARGGITKDNPDEYRAWNLMKRRCYNCNDISYKNYGGRGIKVCKRWRDSFANFLEDMGKKPKGFSLDRINHDKDYCPENCRWADWWTQQRNRTNNSSTPCIRKYRRKFLLTVQKGDEVFRKLYNTEMDAILARDHITSEWRKNA